MSNEYIRALESRLRAAEAKLEAIQAQEITPAAPRQHFIDSVFWLKSQLGPRLVYWGMNENTQPATATLTAVNSAGIWGNDSVRGFPVTYLNQSSNSYLYHYYSAWGYWGYDSGADSWSTQKGITALAWVKISSYTSADQGIIGAWNPYTSDPNYGASWRLFVDSEIYSNKIRASVSSTGAFESGQEAIGDSIASPPTGRWIMAVIRWIKSTSILARIYDGGTITEVENTTSIVSDLFDARYVYLGNYKRSDGTLNRSLNGDLGLASYHAAYMTDAQLAEFYAISRKVYGV